MLDYDKDNSLYLHSYRKNVKIGQVLTLMKLKFTDKNSDKF
jgi:hypothetical protein